MQDNDMRQEVSSEKHTSSLQVPVSLSGNILTRLGLSRGGNETSVDVPIKAIANNDWQTRVKAIQSLKLLEDELVLEPLLSALDDDDESVRAAAVRALGERKYKSSVDPELLVRYLDDSSWLVREMAALTLGELREPSLTELLRPALDDNNIFVREAAQLSLQSASQQIPSHSQSLDFIKKIRNRLLLSLSAESNQVATRLSYSRLKPEGSSSKHHTIMRLIEGTIAICLIMGIIISWFAVTHWFRATSTEGSINIPLWTYQSNMPSLQLRWTADSKALTFLGFSTGTPVEVWERATGQLHGYNANVQNAIWSPDGQYLGTVTDNPATPKVQVQVWNAETGQTILSDSYVRRSVQSTESGNSGANGTHSALLSWSSDSTHIAVASSDGTMQIWGIATKRPPVACYGSIASLLSLAWATNGRFVLSHLADGTIQVCDTSTEQSHIVFKDAGTYDAEISPDGRYIAAIINSTAIQIWDIASDKLLLTYKGQTGGISQIQWLPDSQHIISRVSSRFQGKSNVQVWNALTGRTILNTPLANHSMWELSPNGNYLATEWLDQQTVKVWNTTSGNELRSMHMSFTLLPFSIAWSPDSQYISITGATNLIQVWNTLTGKEIHSYHSSAHSISQALWSPDGKYLATVGSNATIILDSNGNSQASINGAEKDTIEVWQLP